MFLQGGLYVRHGPQSVYHEVIAIDLEDAAFTECNPSGEEEGGGGDEPAEDGEDYSIGGATRTGPASSSSSKGDLPSSQLFHFFSPLKWANVVKLEYQLVPSSPDSDVDGEAEAVYQDSPDDEQGSAVVAQDQFPLKKFELIYQATNATISTIIQASATFFLQQPSQQLQQSLLDYFYSV